MKFIFSAILALSIFNSSLFAQSTQSVFPPLHLSSGKIILGEEPGRAESYREINGRYYALIQSRTDITSLYGIPGIEMLHYLPVNGGVFSIAAHISPIQLQQKLAEMDARISPVRAEWKLSQRLSQGDIPAWAWVDSERIEVWLLSYSDLPMAQFRQHLQNNGLEIIKEKSDQKAVAIAVRPEALTQISQLPGIFFIQEKEEPGKPENNTSRTNQRVNSLQSVYPGAPGFDGSGVVVGLGDDGEIGPHIDYTGRFSQNADPSNGDHGDHVAGTIFGAGNRDPRGRGMAPGAEVYYQSYPDNLADADFNYNNRNVRVTNSSYSNGCNAGYTLFTQQMDQDIIDNPNLLHVFSAGNDGNSDCNYGAGAGWGNITGGHKIAKNVVTVANVTSTDVLAGSSSRGPAEDGRIKPDVAAVGSSVYSTTNPNAYTQKTGTSMSAPAVAGVAAVLYEAYRHHHNNVDPPSGLLKAIMLNSADDLGNNGPDFRFGYGRVNSLKAYEVIQNQQYILSSVNHNDSVMHTITIPENVANAKIMLYWSDPPATTFAARSLVNDLDMKATKGGVSYQPWVLDPTPNAANLNAAAVQGRDSLNNMEQITIANPTTGNLNIKVKGFNIPLNTQSYYIVYYFEKNEVKLTYPMGGEGFVPGQTELIRWDAPAGSGSFSLDYSADGGQSWTNISNSISGSVRYYNWSVPAQAGSNYKLRISRSGKTSETPGTFTIIGRPANIYISRICLDTLSMHWDAVPGASSYKVYALGNKYMDSIGVTSHNHFEIPLSVVPGEQWFSVAAEVNGKTGLRAVAIERPQQALLNCKVQNDLAALSVISPPTGSLSNCYTYNNLPVSLEISNTGLNTIASYTVSYRINGGNVITENINQNIASGARYQHTFAGSGITLSPNSTYHLEMWVNFAGDDFMMNDTIHRYIETYNSGSVSFPYSQNFDSFSNCATSTNCGATICNLSGNWFNSTNGSTDDIDFRVHNGATASSNTGPLNDHTTGIISGKYLYLEASGGCDSARAELMSPCINLANANMPVLEFWYHMNGVNMGKLAVDIFDGQQWHLNVMPELIGNQKTAWNKARINLLPFAGQLITLRFRGKTGNNFTSDIAIDDVSIFENNLPPVAGFTQDNTVSCINGLVNFSDTSQNVPTSWNWQITPATYVLLNGTTLSSPKISLSFTGTATYDVQLTVSNIHGTDTETIQQAVVVDAGASLPLFEDFEGLYFPSPGWSVRNPDNQSGWQRTTVTEKDGFAGQAARFDNFTSGAKGENDALITMNLNLQNINDALLSFDVAYAQYGGKQDSLFVEYSLDCGQTFLPTTYALGGSSLATASSGSGLFVPTSAQHWRSDSIDLSGLAGNSVILQFRNKSAAGNALYLDNIQLTSTSIVAPVAFFSSSEDSLLCLNQNVIFTDSLSGGIADSIYWDFGQNAVPRTAYGPGPHTVKFVRRGLQNVELKVSNSGGLSSYSQNYWASTTPISVFTSTVISPQVVQFNDLSINGPTQWKWYFGDGDSSSLQNPQHTYAAGGTYTVTLEVENYCGQTDRDQILVISGIDIEERLGLYNLLLYPNPGRDIFYLNFSSATGRPVQVQLLDLSGKVIQQRSYTADSGENQIVLDLSQEAEGMYLIRLISDQGSETLRLIKG